MSASREPTAAQTEHQPSFWLRPGRGSRRAECSCGWVGPDRMSPDKAVEDFTKHEEAETSG